MLMTGCKGETMFKKCPLIESKDIQHESNESVNEPGGLLHYTEDKSLRDTMSLPFSVTVSVIDFGPVSSFSYLAYENNDFFFVKGSIMYKLRELYENQLCCLDFLRLQHSCSPHYKYSGRTYSAPSVFCE